MNLWLSSHLLVAGLFLSSSALTPEECQPLMTPLSLADPSTMFGRWNFIAGFTDHEAYNDILKKSDSSWMNFTASTSGHDTIIMSQENRIGGNCMASKVNVAIDGNTLSTSVANVTTTFHLLPSCDGCLLMSANCTARDLDKLLHVMKVDSNVTAEEVHIHVLYLMAREATVKDSDLEHLKQQASCFGFTKEPDFIYDPKNGFCAEGEGFKLF
ncbi:uncharacterized protein LOC129096927 [Anoplopoma fimbria]|uniref:uncharacterized protein LOC129096927 n=1 Tax=Anoplopoma fimbria TaxID=229290 RepID=UPI0023ED6D54|nr:uncharacterized protein LOC129096927 [Anoplopoma fimbria]